MSKKKGRKSTDIVPIMVRMREGLRRRIKREAEERKTSMNAEILRRLNISFSETEMQRAFNYALAPLKQELRRIFDAIGMRIIEVDKITVHRSDLQSGDK